MNPSTEKSI